MALMGSERQRLAEADAGEAPWRRWGPYLAERQWGTVREDYSADGNAWGYFPHDHARSRAYRWGEDGLAGLCDDGQRLCFGLALWNGKDPILKERLFGLTGPEGNHGEDVKEVYYYLDATPTSSSLKYLYKYPQAAFPYAALVEENRRRGRDQPEFELWDTGAFDGDRYFDVTVEVAKADPHDLLIEITAVNREPEAAPLHLLPQLWFRNTWAWGRYGDDRPTIAAVASNAGVGDRVRLEHRDLGLLEAAFDGAPELLFTDNDTNAARLFGSPPVAGYWKDGIHRAVVDGEAGAVNPARTGTKMAAHYALDVPAGGTVAVRLRWAPELPADPFAEFPAVFAARRAEADEFYGELAAPGMSDEARRVQRQAWAGLLWNQMYYFFDVSHWLEGDPGQPAPPAARHHGRNAEWFHFNTADILSMPDKWEYPWFAAWDLAFHCVALAALDPADAKRQLVLLTREWTMHPNGQLPAYEWAFGDANPPVHAWAALKVFDLDRRASGRPDYPFLERILHKLLLNFTWWVNRKDLKGRNVFQGGFLGLDNIGVFDRSAPLPTGGYIDQTDGTSWMAAYSLCLLRMALELSAVNPIYQDIATKFFEHFLYIAGALDDRGGAGGNFWDEEDQFFYDLLELPDGRCEPLKLHSMVGLIPLFAIEVLDAELLDRVPGFKQRLEWFLAYRPDLAALISRWNEKGAADQRLLSLLRGHRLKRLLARMLDPAEFFSPYGIRALSAWHREHPYSLAVGGETFTVSYQPGESDSGLFGGNSNWRGPIWFPVNYLLVEALDRAHSYYGDDFRVECPTGSGVYLSLAEVADELARRLAALFLPDESGRRPVLAVGSRLHDDPGFRDLPLFFEYFHGDTGRGVGASHQTGWTALVADLLARRPRSKE